MRYRSPTANPLMKRWSTVASRSPGCACRRHMCPVPCDLEIDRGLNESQRHLAPVPHCAESTAPAHTKCRRGTDPISIAQEADEFHLHSPIRSAPPPSQTAPNPYAPPPATRRRNREHPHETSRRPADATAARVENPPVSPADR